MRTRLDEIVEEERACLNGWAAYPAGLHKIAERAFRHGVEQRSSYQFNWDDYTEVQPAPAEEKRECCEPLSGHSKFCPRWNDRRKGERRNPLTPAYGTVREDGRRVRRIWRTFSITWQYDRRTGKDRRKP